MRGSSVRLTNRRQVTGGSAKPADTLWCMGDHPVVPRKCADEIRRDAARASMNEPPRARTMRGGPGESETCASR